MVRPLVFGILNITEDSFSDGGRFLDPTVAVAHAEQLIAGGADVVDVGPSSSHPDGQVLTPEQEIARLEPVLTALRRRSIPFSVDSFHTPTQRWALGAGAAWLNDIQGFPDPAVWPELAASEAGLIVMHAIQSAGPARRMDGPTDIVARVEHVLCQRAAGLIEAGVAPERLLLDPGMGFFLGTDPQDSLEVLRHLPQLRERLGLRMLLGVSRKSFIQRITGCGVDQVGPGTLATELIAIQRGADAIRTHDPAALKQAIDIHTAMLTCASS